MNRKKFSNESNCTDKIRTTRGSSAQRGRKSTPKDNEVLVKIFAASVNAIDPLIVRRKPFFLRLTARGILKPKHNHTILGDDISGQVEIVGRDVEQFQPGDEVFGNSNWGDFTEYRCVPEERLVLKPANISFEEAAAVPRATITALQGLHDKKQILTRQLITFLFSQPSNGKL